LLLRRDVVPISGTELAPGNVQLRPGKRPRPIVLRMNVGDSLRITAAIRPDPPPQLHPISVMVL